MKAVYPPSCVAALEQACPRQGPCTYEESEDETERRTCYATGVRSVLVSVPVDGGCFPTTEEHVYQSDGSLCWSRSVLPDPRCETNRVTIKDASGTEIAVGGTMWNVNSSYYSLACKAGGDSYACDWDTRSSRSCASDPQFEQQAGPECEPGVCP